MSKFVTGKELENVVYDILFEAKHKLVLLSPYIKLDDYFRNQLLARHAHNPELELVVVFGKNEGNVTRSVSRADIDYFTGFMNVTIVYAPNLHAKYYGNEGKGVVTSINLYDYSFRNNIEFGVYSENAPIMEKFLEAMNRKSLEDQSFEQAMQVAATHDVIFAKRPIYKLRGGLMSKLVGSSLGKDYLGAEVVFDAVDALLGNRPYEAKRLAEFPKEVEFQQLLPQVRPNRPEADAKPVALSAGAAAAPPAPQAGAATPPGAGYESRQPESRPFAQVQTHANEPSPAPAAAPRAVATLSHPAGRVQAPAASSTYSPDKAAWQSSARPPEQGYCIRTGTAIPFNPERPFCYAAYKSWVKFSNDDYPERYCHKSGQQTNGKTSKRSPILLTGRY